MCGCEIWWAGGTFSGPRPLGPLSPVPNRAGRHGDLPAPSPRSATGPRPCPVHNHRTLCRRLGEGAGPQVSAIRPPLFAEKGSRASASSPHRLRPLSPICHGTAPRSPPGALPQHPAVGVLTATAAASPNLQDRRSNGSYRVQNPSQSICGTAGQQHAATATTVRPHTGKTLVAARGAEELRAGRVLVLVPSLDLLAQTETAWRASGRGGPLIGVSSLRGG